MDSAAAKKILLSCDHPDVYILGASIIADVRRDWGRYFPHCELRLSDIDVYRYAFASAEIMRRSFVESAGCAWLLFELRKFFRDDEVLDALRKF